MKKLPFAIILILTGFISCKKSGSGLYEPALIDSWHLISSGSILFPQTPTDSVLLTFQTSGKYVSKSNTTVTETGSYKFIKEKTLQV